MDFKRGWGQGLLGRYCITSLYVCQDLERDVSKKVSNVGGGAGGGDVEVDAHSHSHPHSHSHSHSHSDKIRFHLTHFF